MATSKAPRKPRKEPMSRVDTAWLRMERPTNPMMITGVLMLDEPMTLETLKKLVRKRCLTTRRKASIDIGSANISTPVIIIGLVGRSMRNQAVSTRDIGSRRARLRGSAVAMRPPSVCAE